MQRRAVIAGAWLVLAAWALPARGDDTFGDGEKTFQRARELLSKEYVDDKLTDDKLWRAATEGLFAGDGNGKWDKLLSPTELAELQADIAGEMVGLGIQMTADEAAGVVVIERVIPNTAAARAGLAAGDEILKVDGRPVRGIEEKSVARSIRGPAGTNVTLTVLRDSQIFTRTVKRARFVFEPVTQLALPNGVALVQVRMFSEKTPQLLRSALERARAQGVKALVLDVRDNPGGLFERMIDCASLLLPRGAVVVSAQHRGGKSEDIRTSAEPLVSGIPVAVLVNGDTASSAEMLAGAMQAAGAHVVGKRTMGKWNAQRLVELGNGWAAKMTVAWFRTPSGAMLDGKGLEPDVEVEMSPKATTRIVLIRDPDKRLAADSQLRAAVNLLKLSR
jgi:carboxyl-terminal processing protease